MANILIYGRPDASCVYLAAQLSQNSNSEVFTYWTDKSGHALRSSDSDNLAGVATAPLKVVFDDFNFNQHHQQQQDNNSITLYPNALDLNSNTRIFDIVILSLGSLRDVSRAKRSLNSIILANRTLVLVNCSRNPPLQQFVREKIPQALAIMCDGLFYADADVSTSASSTASALDPASSAASSPSSSHGPSLTYHAQVDAVAIEPLEALSQRPDALVSAYEHVRRTFEHVLYDTSSCTEFLAKQWTAVIPVIAIECLCVAMDMANVHELTQSVVARPLIDGLIKELAAIATASSTSNSSSDSEVIRSMLPTGLDDVNWQSIKTVTCKEFEQSRSPVMFYDFYFHHDVSIDLLLLYPILICDDVAEKSRRATATSYLECLFAFMTTLTRINDARDERKPLQLSLFARNEPRNLRAPLRSSSSSTSCSSPDSLELSVNSTKSSAATSTTSVSDLRAREEAIVAKEQALYSREKVLSAKETEVQSKMQQQQQQQQQFAMRGYNNSNSNMAKFPMSPAHSPHMAPTSMANGSRQSMQQRPVPPQQQSYFGASSDSLAPGPRPRIVSSSASVASFNMHDPMMTGGPPRDVDMMSITSKRRMHSGVAGYGGHGARRSMVPSASQTSLLGTSTSVFDSTAPSPAGSFRNSHVNTPGTPSLPWSQQFSLDGAITTSENDRYGSMSPSMSMRASRRFSFSAGQPQPQAQQPPPSQHQTPSHHHNSPGPQGYVSQPQLHTMRSYTFTRQETS